MSQRKPVAPSSVDVRALQAELAACKLGWQRTQADFDNFRRRSAAEQAERTASDVGRALVPLTAVAENLRRATDELDRLNRETASTEGLRAWTAGVQSIARQFDQALEAAGVKLIDPGLGEPFDPRVAEALTHQPHADHSADTVTQVVERGYRVGTHVLVPAKVIVSSGQPQAERSMQNEESSVE